MTESRVYAVQLEKKLIDEFKQKFYEKLGYEPVVFTQVETSPYAIPMMSLQQLAEYFEPFLPYLYDKKLTLFCKSRKREVVELRMMYCFLARMMKYKLETVGQILGGRDHTTVMHNVTSFTNLMETNDQFRVKFFEILNHIKENHESPNMDQLDQTQHKPEPVILP